MVKLINYTEYLSRGAILKCKGKYPYEDTLYFMVAEQIGVQAYQLCRYDIEQITFRF